MYKLSHKIDWRRFEQAFTPLYCSDNGRPGEPKSIRVNDDQNDKNHHDTAFIDSTVQEKNVTYPTDAKLHKK